MNIISNVTELIGHTPLAQLDRFCEAQGVTGVRLLAKLEYLNPAGSVKDRAALSMVLDAERRGLLRPGATIIEPTSGNTGIGLAIVAAARGYRAILTLPETMSVERRKLLTAYGAQLVLTDGRLGMAGAIARAEELHAATPGSIILGQFVNPANAQAHYETTGSEIWADTDGAVDAFVAGVGTGGTITGTGRYLKEQNAGIRVIAVEPETSAVLSGRPAGAHPLQGIGAGFVPEVLDTGVYDEVLTVDGEDAYAMSRCLSRTEGYLVGITSGAALAAAVRLARRSEYRGKTIVALLPDSGDRYLSTPLFE